MNVRRKLILVLLKLIAIFLMSLAFVHLISAVLDLLQNQYRALHLVLIYFQLVVEATVFFQSSFMIFEMSNSLFEDYQELQKKVPPEYPTIDVYIPIRRVDPEILEETIIGILEQDYPSEKVQVFIADDTPEDSLVQQYTSLARKYSIKYIHKPSNRLYKSGMLNLAIPYGNSEYIAFFDYDQVPTPGIFKHMIEILNAYPDKAFVQTKKRFKNLYNLSRVWSALLYVQFFEVVEKTKMELGTVLFAGSTACFRRSILEEVGGIPEETFTEDNELTTRLLLEGYEGLFSDVYGSIGTVPYGFPAQVSQLWRWSHGGSHVLRKDFKRILKSDKLNWNQKIDIMSLLAVTVILVSTYLYIISFFPLLIAGVNSPRFEFFGVSTLIFIPIAPATTYVIVAAVALWKVKQHNDEFRMRQLPGFIIIALAANILIMASGIFGILGIWGPNSSKGKWTRSVPIKLIALISAVIGYALIFFSVQWLIAGLSSAIITFVMGLSLLPTLPVVLYYSRESTY